MRPDRIAAIALTALAAVIAWQSTTWPAAGEFAGDPVVMPRVLAALMVVTALALAFGRRPLPAAPAEGRPQRVLAGVALTLALASVLTPLGLIAAGVPYLLALMRVTRAPWRTALPVAIAAPVVVWGVFAMVLNVPLPAGILSGWLGR